MTVRNWLLLGLLTVEPALLPAQGRPVPPPLAISMRDAIQMALSPQGNLGVGVAAESVRVAEARWRESRSARLPSVETSITGRNQVLNLAALGFESAQLPRVSLETLRSVGPFNTLDARVQVRQSLLDPAIARRSRAARADRETAKDETDEVRDEVAVQAATAYLKALRAASAQEWAQARVEAAEAALQEVTNRSAAGKALSVDVSRARVRLGAEKQRVLEVRMERDRAVLELLAVLNRDLDTPLTLTDQLDFTPQEMLPTGQAVAIALKSRADLAAIRQRIEAARLHDDSIRAEALPTIEAYADGGTLGTSVGTSSGTYTVGVSLHVPVFNGGRRAAHREENLALLRQEELRASRLENEIALQVRDALIKLETARGKIELSAEEMEVARQDVLHYRRRHDEGIGGLLDIFEAQASLASATDNRAAALFAWNQGRIDLMQAMGTIRSLAQ
jgi:outer membrane protein TolC